MVLSMFPPIRDRLGMPAAHQAIGGFRWFPLRTEPPSRLHLLIRLLLQQTRRLLGSRLPPYTSSGSGVTWISNSIPGSWFCVASSADGSELAAANLDNGDFSQTGLWIGRRTPSPKLNVAAANTNLTLSWIVSSTNFVLQQNLDLSSANWTTISNLPSLNLSNLQDQVTLTPSNGNGFFRLIAQ